MTPLYAAGLAVLLLSARTTPALAACVNANCTDTTAIEQARNTIQSTCGCMRAGQTHGKYTKCVKSTLKLANLTALIPQKACRKLIMRCENASTCGKPNAVVCCVAKANGKVKASVVGTAAKCRNGSACGALLGFFSKFDACAADGSCAGPTTTSTSSTTLAGTPSTTTTSSTMPPAGGAVLKGVLPSTTGLFNFTPEQPGIPGADTRCNVEFPGTHSCTFAELQNAATAGDLAGVRDVDGTTVTSFWLIDASHPNEAQCNLTAAGPPVRWQYQTVHTGVGGERVALDNATGNLGETATGLICFQSSWVGCCQ
jgi:hypothetical protein